MITQKQRFQHDKTVGANDLSALRVDCGACVAERARVRDVELAAEGAAVAARLDVALGKLGVIEQHSTTACEKHSYMRLTEAKELRGKVEQLQVAVDTVTAERDTARRDLAELRARLEQQEERHALELAERERAEDRLLDELKEAARGVRHG